MKDPIVPYSPGVRTVLNGVAMLAALFLLVLSGRAMIQRGGPGYAATIASRTGLSPRASENALLLLERARREIPAGSTVVFIDDQKRGSASVNYAVAVGVLPRQHVLPAEFAGFAQYVIVLHGGEKGEVVRRR